MRKLLASLSIACVIFTSSAFAQTQVLKLEAEMLVPKDKGADKYDIVIKFAENDVTFDAGKPNVTKVFRYSDIKSAEYSFAKQPRFKTGLVLALALSIFLLPIMFTKSKQHWLSVQTEKEFVVLKLKKDNFRMIFPAFETKGVKVVDVGNEEDKKTDKDK